tara:strand:- start:175 stop:453 length:279 start_codon:yes stop_codon:yes gene_type:complete
MKHTVVITHTHPEFLGQDKWMPFERFNGEKVFITYESSEFNPATEQFDIIKFNAVTDGLGCSRNYDSRHEAIMQLSKAHSCVVKSIEDNSED